MSAYLWNAIERFRNDRCRQKRPTGASMNSDGSIEYATHEPAGWKSPAVVHPKPKDFAAESSKAMRGMQAAGIDARRWGRGGPGWNES